MRSLTISTAAANPPNQPSISAQNRSQWHTSVPYLFGGLSAMLGLIAFALILLACSYCRLDNNNNKESDVERDAERVKTPKMFVIMAGDNMPSFIATPMGRAALFGDDNKDKTEKNCRTEEGGKIGEETSNFHENGLTQDSNEENSGRDN